MPDSWYSNRKGDKGLHCHLQQYYINISHTITVLKLLMMHKMNTKHQERVTHKLKAQVTCLFLLPFSLTIPLLLRQLEQEVAMVTDGE